MILMYIDTIKSDRKTPSKNSQPQIKTISDF